VGYLLDTSALSAFTQPSHQFYARAQSVISAIPRSTAMFASVVALGEMEFGLNMAIANGSRHVADIQARIAVVRQYALLPITHHTASSYAELKAKLAMHIQPSANRRNLHRYLEMWQEENTGNRIQIDENDLWIAAQAKERDLVIITGDPDFRILERVDSDIHAIYVCP
jgi:predicted nucleic acid-binding protein